LASMEFDSLHLMPMPSHSDNTCTARSLWSMVREPSCT
jgi:hypothetical protein